MNNLSIPLALLIIQKRILMFFILVLAIVVWIRQEWHVLGKFEFTEAMQTKRQIIHFNGSNFVLFVNWFIRRGIFPHPVSPRSSIVPGIVLSRINGTIHPTAMLVDNNTVTIWSISLTPTNKKRGHCNPNEGNMCLR